MFGQPVLLWSRQCGVSCLLEASLGPVKERPPAAKHCLDLLGVKEYASKTRRRKFASAAGFSSLPVLDLKGRLTATLGMSSFRTADAITAASEHSDGDVAATLGGLSKALVMHGDVDGAIAACAEWLGVSASEGARESARAAWYSLLNRQGDAAVTLDLSIAAHGHWHESNLAGPNFIARTCAALWERKPLQLRHVFLDGQSRIQGTVLDSLLKDEGIPTLRELKMNGCSGVIGSLPPSIAHCTALRVLDVCGCALSGASTSSTTFQLFSTVAVVISPRLSPLLGLAGDLPLSSLPTSLETLNIKTFASDTGRRRSSDSFTGTYDMSLFSRLTNLKVVKMAQCGLKGVASSALLGLSHFDLRGNTGLRGQASLAGWLLVKYPSSALLNATRHIDASHQSLSGAGLAPGLSAQRIFTFLLGVRACTHRRAAPRDYSHGGQRSRRPAHR